MNSSKNLGAINTRHPMSSFHAEHQPLDGQGYTVRPVLLQDLNDSLEVRLLEPSVLRVVRSRGRLRLGRQVKSSLSSTVAMSAVRSKLQENLNCGFHSTRSCPRERLILTSIYAVQVCMLGEQKLDQIIPSSINCVVNCVVRYGKRRNKTLSTGLRSSSGGCK